MSTSKSKTAKNSKESVTDRSKGAEGQGHEVAYESKKVGEGSKAIKSATKNSGNTRPKDDAGSSEKKRK